MCRKSPNLEELIAAEIADHGPITFARFMERALYDPALGYYASGRAGIGREGDFFTNVSVSPLFGRLLAGQFEEMWLQLDQPARFTIVEQGANDGQLAADILAALQPPFATACEYCIIEPLEVLRTKQRDKLENLPVRWVESLEALPSFEGVHFSNELVDALPFHLVRSNGETWEEQHVSMDEGRLNFVSEAASAQIASLIAALPQRETGTLAELRPAAESWMQTLAGKLQRGYVLVIDYGFSREQILAPHRREGTFSCYRAHHRDAKPLEDPGQKDITAHVDFSSLAQAATKEGLHLAGFTDQHHFLVGASEALLKSLDGKVPDATTGKTLRALRTLLHPESMGTQFHYLAFSKQTGADSGLSGFRHARTSGAELVAPSGDPALQKTAEI